MHVRMGCVNEDYNRRTVKSHLELEHGTEFFLPDLQGANLRGQSHDCGVETLVLTLAGNNSVSSFYPSVLRACKHRVLKKLCKIKSTD